MLVNFEAIGFRNLAPLKLELSPGSHLIIGANGAGKTSLLEAVYLLATTRSFRTSRISDCCRHGEILFNLAGETDTDRRVKIQFKWTHGQRERTLNGGRTSLGEHLAVLPVIAWTASDTEILVGPPAVRRRFLDRGVVGLRPAAIDVLSRYRQALQEKRRLLQGGGHELRAWNEVLAGVASKLIRLRSSYADLFGSALRSILAQCPLELGKIDVHYQSSLKEGLNGPSAIVAELTEAAARERALQQPILGPHRDDLVIRWDGHELKRVASAGERKALGLVLLAAHGRVLEESGRGGIYLLDDVDTELDRERLTALWGVFCAAKQVLITSNRPQVWTDIEVGHTWTCAKGHLKPLEQD